MEKMLINERFKSPNKEFEKVFNLFRKKDYFDEKSQVKKKQEEFVRFLKKGDPMATKVFKQNKENMKSSLSFIEDMVMDYNKKNHFEAFKIFSTAVNDVEMKDSKSAEKSGNFIKSKIHNNSQKYSLGVYSAIRKQKFNNYKDVHKDVDELISKNEGFSSDAQRKAAFANGYEEKDKKNEGKKRFKRQDGIGKAKYTISYHDGKKKHKDGSDFFDIKIFKNKKDLSDFVGTLAKQGYKLTRESVNEVSDSEIKKIIKKKEKGGPYTVVVQKGSTSKHISHAKDVGDSVDKAIKVYHQFKKKHRNGVQIIDGYGRTVFFESLNKEQDVINEASIKGKNNKTGESFGMVIGSDKKNREGDFEVTIRKTYSSRITSYKFIFDNSSNLIDIADYGYSMDGKFPDMKGGGSVKSVKPNPRETITQIAKVTSPAFAKKIVQHVKKVNESVNEGKYNYKADALTAYFKGKIDAKELDKIARDDFKSGIATKKELSNFLSNKFTQDVMSDTYGIPAGTLIKRVRGLMKFAEGKDDGVPQGYNPMVENKKQIKDLVKKVKHEKLFYDVLDTMEKKYGKRKYRIWLEKSLKDFGVNPKHYDYRTNAGAEEKLFQLGK